VIRFRHVTKELFSSVTPFFAWQIRIRRDRKNSRGLAFALRKSLRPETNRDHLKLPLDAEREDVVLSLRFIVNYRARPDDRRVT